MFCTKCGKKIEEGNSFCTNCGQSIDIKENSNESSTTNNIDNIQVNTPPVNNNVVKNNNPSGVVIASLVIGIISSVLSFVIGPFVIPLAIVGFCLGIINKDKGAIKITGIILNCISAVIGIFVLVFFVSFLLMTLIAGSSIDQDPPVDEIPVSGFWDCKSFDGAGPSDDYVVTFNLKDDYDFSWYKYDDMLNNYVNGKYTYEDLHKTTETGSYKYYKIKLNSKEFVENGIENPKQFTAEYEIGINENENEAVFLNTETYSMYYCYK